VTSAATSTSAPSASVAHDTLVTLTVESLDLRATTPALLAWVRGHGLALVSMQAEPVTLTDVFMALTRRQLASQPFQSQGSADSVERRG
jgi:hypothetical protein